MGPVLTDTLTPAKLVLVSQLSGSAEVSYALEQLHSLVLAVCPECLMKLRGPTDGGVIYVPPERTHALRNENLLTVWPESASVRMRIVPIPEEHFDTASRTSYLERLRTLHAKLLACKD